MQLAHHKVIDLHHVLITLLNGAINLSFELRWQPRNIDTQEASHNGRRGFVFTQTTRHKVENLLLSDLAHSSFVRHLHPIHLALQLRYGMNGPPVKDQTPGGNGGMGTLVKK